MNNFEWKTITRQQKTMQSNSLRRRVNLLFFKWRTLKTLQLAHLQNAGFAKEKNMGLMSPGIYKRNVTSAMMSAILPSFARKSHFRGLALQKVWWRVLRAFSLYANQFEKSHFREKFVITVWKVDKQRKLSCEIMSQLTEQLSLTTYIANFGGPYPTTQRGNQFYFLYLRGCY